MGKKNFKVNQLIDIEYELTGEDGQTIIEYYPSRIRDVYPDYLVIDYPLREGYPLPLHVNEVITLRFIQNQTPYECSVKIISKQSTPVPLLKVTLPKKIIKVQKRNWVRLPYTTEVKYRLAGYRVPYYKGLSVDISGGGLLLHTNHPIDVDEILEIEFAIDDTTISTTCRVVRCTPVKQVYRIALEFIALPEAERDKIMGFIFQKQREMIKKGLL